MAKLTEKSNAVYTYLIENGGHVSIEELATALGTTTRSVGANVTDLTKKSLAVRVDVEVEGADKPAKYVDLVPDHAAVFEALPERK